MVVHYVTRTLIPTGTLVYSERYRGLVCFENKASKLSRHTLTHWGSNIA